MRLVLSMVLGLALTGAAYAQRGGGGHTGGHAGGGGIRGGSSFSHGGFSGGAIRGGFTGGSVFRGPNRGGIGFRGGFNRGFGFRRFGIYSGYYGWPAYSYGYGYGYGYDPYWSDPYWNDTYTTALAPYSPYYNTYQSAPPPVVMNELPAPPPPQSYEQAYAPPRSNEPLSYLIAFNDHNIKMAVAYWTENHNLRYVTMEHEIKTAPLSSVDRDLSMQLNRERRVTFSLPATGG